MYKFGIFETGLFLKFFVSQASPVNVEWYAHVKGIWLWRYSANSIHTTTVFHERKFDKSLTVVFLFEIKEIRFPGASSDVAEVEELPTLMEVESVVPN